MKAMELKTELLALIEKENDQHLLEAIFTILKKSSLDPTLRNKLTSRALKAENDIEQGRTMERAAFEKKLGEKFGL